MAKKNSHLMKYLVIAIVAYLSIAFMAGWFPFDGNGIIPQTPINQVSQTCLFKSNLASKYNESFSAGDASGSLYIYTMSYVLLETISYSSGFTSALYYDSGESVRYKWVSSGWQTISGIFSFPYYQSAEQPISGYHTLDNIIVSEDPTIATSYTLNDIYNTSAITTYDVSASGTNCLMEVIFRNTLDDSCNFNWNDANYAYRPVVIIENFYNSSDSDCAPLEISIQGLVCIQAETTTQSGLYIFVPSEDSLDRDKNQATGVLNKNNAIRVSFTIDCSQISGDETAYLKFFLYENDDVAYHSLYGNPLSSATTWDEPVAHHVKIQA